MSARTSRDRHGGGRNIIDRIETETALGKVTAGILSPSRLRVKRGAGNG